MTLRKTKIMIVAGEASGDVHAAKLVRAVRNEEPSAEFFGAVSHQMREAGVIEIVDADHFSIVGLPEIARALPMFLRAFRCLVRAAEERRPDAVVLVDFPEFNLKLAKALKKRGFPVVYYISPQIWAWRKYRVAAIRKYVDLLLTILPFEKEWYSENGVDHVEYVGNPTVREIHATASKAEFCEAHKLDPVSPIVALLPGSRHKEIARILPPLLETASIIHRSNESVQFVVPLAANRSESEVDEAIIELRQRGIEAPPVLRIVQGETHNALNAADAAAVTSGTATLETAIIGTPMAIVYKTSGLNYKLMRPLITVSHFGLINLIAGERIVREMIQDEFTPDLLAEEIFGLLEPQRNAEIRRRLQSATAKLGQGGASTNAARAVLKLLKLSEITTE